MTTRVDRRPPDAAQHPDPRVRPHGDLHGLPEGTYYPRGTLEIEDPQWAYRLGDHERLGTHQHHPDLWVVTLDMTPTPDETDGPPARRWMGLVHAPTGEILVACPLVPRGDLLQDSRQRGELAAQLQGLESGALLLGEALRNRRSMEGLHQDQEAPCGALRREQLLARRGALPPWSFHYDGRALPESGEPLLTYRREVDLCLHYAPGSAQLAREVAHALNATFFGTSVVEALGHVQRTHAELFAQHERLTTLALLSLGKWDPLEAVSGALLQFCEELQDCPPWDAELHGPYDPFPGSTTAPVVALRRRTLQDIRHALLTLDTVAGQLDWVLHVLRRLLADDALGEATRFVQRSHVYPPKEDPQDAAVQGTPMMTPVEIAALRFEARVRRAVERSSDPIDLEEPEALPGTVPPNAVKARRWSSSVAFHFKRARLELATLRATLSWLSRRAGPSASFVPLSCITQTLIIGQWELAKGPMKSAREFFPQSRSLAPWIEALPMAQGPQPLPTPEDVAATVSQALGTLF